MDKNILSKSIQIEGYNLNIYKTLPLKPIDMYSFLVKYLPTGNEKKMHPDFKHMFDYVESIKQYNNIYLLSVIYLPPCPSNANALGNFFGQKMNNVSKDLKIFPFGNIITSHISLVSKRTTYHPTFLLLSLKGNKNLHDSHPSNTDGSESVGNYVLNNWTNVILRRYNNYLTVYGLKTCIAVEYLNKFKINKTEPETEKENKTTNNTIETLHNNTIETTHNNTSEPLDNTIINNMQCMNYNEILNQYVCNNLALINSMASFNILQSQNSLSYMLNNLPSSLINDMDQFNNTQSIIYNHTFTKYQQEIVNLRKLIIYFIKHNGNIEKDILEEFPEEFLQKNCGHDFKMLMLNKTMETVN
jgi:hypothetical protein